MKFDPKPNRIPDLDEPRGPRVIKPRAFDGAAFPGWGPKLG
jgi:hypothetical protein